MSQGTSEKCTNIVIDECLDLDLRPLPVNGLLQQTHDVVVLHAWTREALGPAGEAGGGERVLLAGEGKGETE